MKYQCLILIFLTPLIINGGEFSSTLQIACTKKLIQNEQLWQENNPFWSKLTHELAKQLVTAKYFNMLSQKNIQKTIASTTKDIMQLGITKNVFPQPANGLYDQEWFLTNMSLKKTINEGSNQKISFLVVRDYLLANGYCYEIIQDNKKIPCDWVAAFDINPFDENEIAVADLDLTIEIKPLTKNEDDSRIIKFKSLSKLDRKPFWNTFFTQTNAEPRKVTGLAYHRQEKDLLCSTTQYIPSVQVHSLLHKGAIIKKILLANALTTSMMSVRWLPPLRAAIALIDADKKFTFVDLDAELQTAPILLPDTNPNDHHAAMMQAPYDPFLFWIAFENTRYDITLTFQELGKKLEEIDTLFVQKVQPIENMQN